MGTKIGIYQGTTDYPSLHVMVTNNERYLEGRIVLTDVEEAVTRFRKWLAAAAQVAGRDYVNKKTEGIKAK